MQCAVCSNNIENDGAATQIFCRHGIVVTITDTPAVAIYPVCGNAVLEWEIAQQVEDLVKVLFTWAETYNLPKPMVIL